jgi:hypothetical protein
LNKEIFEFLKSTSSHIPRGVQILNSMKNNGWYLHSLIEVDPYQTWAPTIFCMKRYYASKTGLRHIYYWVDCRQPVLEVNNDIPVVVYVESSQPQIIHTVYEDFITTLINHEAGNLFLSLPVKVQDLYYMDFMKRYFSNKTGMELYAVEEHTLKDVSVYSTLFSYRFNLLPPPILKTPPDYY